MHIIRPSVELLTRLTGFEILKDIEIAGRTCYKSEDKMTEDSCIKFIQMLLRRNHLAMIEFGDMIARFICDRGVTHEIVRHRLFSFAQESTRYCNYSLDKYDGELTFIEPCFWYDRKQPESVNIFDAVDRVYTKEENNWYNYQAWLKDMEKAEKNLPVYDK